MSDANRNTAYKFSKAFLTVFTILTMYILASVIFSMLFGPVLGYITFTATLVTIFMTDEIAKKIWNKVESAADVGAKKIVRGLAWFANLFKASPAADDVAAAPAAA